AQEIARVDLTRSLLHLEAGEPQKAIEAAREVAESPAASDDWRLYFWGRINLARAYVETRDLRGAKRIVQEDEAKHRSFGEPLIELRYTWLRGKIAAAESDPEAAGVHFRAARDGFLAAKIGYDAAMVSLDLDNTELRAGRRREARRLSGEVIPLFTTQEVHREALAALRLFQQAGAQEA